MSALPFRYSNEQWRALEEVVARAGGDEAREKFTAGRARVERTVGGYKDRLTTWDGLSYGSGEDDQKKHERIERAARELGAALDAYGSWIALADNADELLRLRGDLSRVALRAGKMAATGRKSQNLMRDRFFLALMRTWEAELALHIGKNIDAPIVAFIKAASEGVLTKKPGKETISEEIISNVVRRWKGGIKREKF
jgi:hypothetical protein